MRTKIMTLIGGVILGAIMVRTPAFAETTVRIAFNDPLSGGNGNTGELAYKELVFLADKINAAGGVNGMKLEIIPFDNKSDPQEALVQAQKSIDQNIRFIMQGVSASAVGAALTDFVQKYNERNVGKEVLYLNIAANDTSLTNDKCNYWHFRFSSNNDMKTTALMAYMASDAKIKKVYLVNPDYSPGRAVRDLAIKVLKEKRPDIEIVGSDLVPIFKVSDFAPYIAKIKAAGADSVVTSTFSQDMALLMKAAAEGNLKANWYTFYAFNPGGPTALKQANLANRVFNQSDSFANNPSIEPLQAEFRQKYSGSMIITGAILGTQYLVEALRQTKSTDPVAIAKAMENMKLKTYNGDSYMRPDDHQMFEDVYMSSFAPVTKDAPLDEEGTGWGWIPLARIPAAETILPTTCKMERP